MQTRNILVIAYYFPPMGLSGVQRIVKFCKYLPEYGWNPIILTTTPVAYYAFDDTLEEDVSGLRVYRTEPDVSKFAKIRKKQGTLEYPSTWKQKIKKYVLQSIFQPDSRRLWKKPAVELGDKIFKENKIDLILATAPPFTDFLVAGELSKKYNVPFILDYRDLWVDNAYYFYASPFHKLYAQKLESDLLTRAYRAVVTSRKMKEMLLKRYKFLSHEDVVIIPHGYDSEDFEDIQVHKDNSKFIITHSGLFPDDLTPRYFLKALALLLKEKPELRDKIEARFAGVMKKNHLRIIKRYKLQGVVKTIGYLPHVKAVENLLQSDLLWMMIPNDVATPSRLYEYLGAGKPMIICAPPGHIRQTALESKVAITTAPKDVKAIQNAIKNFFELWQNGRMPQPDFDYVRQFDRKVLTGALARELALGADFVE